MCEGCRYFGGGGHVGPENGTLLDEAKTIINAERQAEYGPPHASFRRIAGLWSAYLGVTIQPRDVACMMALLKIGREAHAHKRDNLVDAAGYIALAEDVADEGEI